MARVSVLVTGDSIVAQPISGEKHPNFHKLVELMRSTDVSIANLEIIFPGADRRPSTLYHGVPINMEPELLSEFEYLGFDLFGLANNHVLDYGVEGLVSSIEELERRGLPFAGVGRTLSEALAARTVERAGTTVALIAAGTTHARLAAAADPTGGDRGRAGIAPVRIDKVHYIDRDRFEDFRDVFARSGVDVKLAEAGSSRMYFPYPDRAIYLPPPAGGFAVEGIRFVPDANPRVETVAVERDVEALIASVSEAAASADVIIVALHSHEGAGGRWNGETLAEFLQPLAYRLIDAGASAVVNHGPHTLRGVEVYKGRPICYSLSNFIYRIDTVASFPAEFYEQVGLPDTSSPPDIFSLMKGFLADPHLWDSIVSRFVFEDGKVAAVEIHPITLMDAEMPGIPKLADVAEGTRILQEMIRLSASFGTEINVVEADGHVMGIVPL